MAGVVGSEAGGRRSGGSGEDDEQREEQRELEERLENCARAEQSIGAHAGTFLCSGTAGVRRSRASRLEAGILGPTEAGERVPSRT